MSNILFNASQCGLGNNGGTKTIIRCAETLQEMGHTVIVWADTNNYTWHKPKCAIKDAYSLIGLEGYSHVLVSVWELAGMGDPPNYNNIIWYMRAWNTWLHGEQWLTDQIKRFTDAGGRIIVNATHLQERLKGIGVESVVCFSGLDEWENHFDWNETSPKHVIGGLIYKRHETKNSDIVRKYCNNTINIDGNSDNDTLNCVYGDCHIWLATSTNEGFHNVPAEAAMSGCYVIGVDHPHSGTGDYLTDKTGALYKTEAELMYAIENPDFSKVEKMHKVLREKIGSREKNMRKFAEILQA